MKAGARTEAVLSAVADPRRRALFERVAAVDGLTVAALTAGSGVTQGAVSQHLKVLRDAGLVTGAPQGRHVVYRAAPDALKPIADWLAGYERFWAGRMASLHVLAAELEDE